jgi:tetratricopeptide (TPR) repeat protein
VRAKKNHLISGRIAAAVAFFLALSVPASADNQFGYFTRCMNQKLPAVERIANCQQMVGTGHGKLFDSFYEGKIGAIYSDAGRYEEAIGAFDQALVLTPNYDAVIAQRCWARAMTGKDLDIALADCDRALELRPDNAYFLDDRGMALFKLGHFDAAQHDYDAALKIEPKLASSMFMRGIVERRVGKTVSGDADIAAAKALDPNILQSFKVFGIVP